MNTIAAIVFFAVFFYGFLAFIVFGEVKNATLDDYLKSGKSEIRYNRAVQVRNIFVNALVFVALPCALYCGIFKIFFADYCKFMLDTNEEE